MRRMTLIMSLVWCAVSYQEAHAQGFWYVPPGADYSYRYGIDVGNGLGFGYGYGFGYGSAISPQTAAASAAMDLAQLQRQSSFVQSQILQGDQEFGFDDSWNQWSPPVVAKKKLVQVNSKKKLHSAVQPVALAKPTLPLPLNETELDRQTGHLDWPVALVRHNFSLQRNEVESLLKASGECGVSSEISDGIRQKVRELREELRQQIRQLSSTDYLNAKSFLERLALEANQPDLG